MTRKKYTTESIFGNQSHWIINKKMYKKYGSDFTLILQHLHDLQKNVFGHKEFFQQQWRIANELNLSERTVDRVIKKIQTEGFLVINKRDKPAKNYYKVNESYLLEFLTSEEDIEERLVPVVFSGTLPTIMRDIEDT
jgi:biotin operon repressor